MSIWFEDPGNGWPNATSEELAEEPVTHKAARLLSVFKAFADQDAAPFMAFSVDGEQLVTMKMGRFAEIIELVGLLLKDDTL